MRYINLYIHIHTFQRNMQATIVVVVVAATAAAVANVALPCRLTRNSNCWIIYEWCSLFLL